MKGFVIKILAFVAILAAIDLAVLFGGDLLFSKAKGGTLGELTYPFYNSNEDIIILGSSRAQFHYDAKQIQDSLGMTCYNAGVSGNGVIYYYPALAAMLKRYVPKCILLEVTVWPDMEKTNDERFIGPIKPFLNSDRLVDSISQIVDPNIRYKKHFGTYKYNSQLTSLLMSPLKQPDNNQGFNSLHGQVKRIGKKGHGSEHVDFDPFKLSLLEKTIALAKSKTNVIVFVSPIYSDKYDKDELYRPLQQICDRYGVPLHIFWTDWEQNRKSFYKDNAHLNIEGAKAYTKDIIPIIKSELASD